MSYSETLLSKRPSERLSKYDSVITVHTQIGDVPLYKVIEKFLFIEDAEGNTISFILNDDQVSLYESMCVQVLNGDPVRIDILKARQKGFSTFIAAVIFCLVIFVPGQKAAIVADIAEHASNLFDKYNFFYDHLPKELQPTKIKSNAKELVVSYGGVQRSSIRIMVQGDSAGRSGTYQYLHLSECAFWQYLEDTLVSLLQTVSATNKKSMVFIETTANGVNDYKVRWDRDYGGGTRYLAKFYAWFTTERYRVSERDYREFLMPDWLKDLKEQENLDKFQCAWYYDRYNDFNGDLDKLRQEYPSNPVEAFVTSGNSVFNAELTRKRKIELINKVNYEKGLFTFVPHWSEDKKVCSMTNIQFVESRNGSIKIFQKPIAGHPYVVCNDPANGGEDYFATQVFDNHTGVQVAVYHRNKCDADDAAYQMYCLHKYYNNALVTGETNTTSYLLEVNRCCGVQNVYQDQDVEDLSGRFANKLGYKIKKNNRTYGIDLFKIAFRENPEIINDYDTICEMESFQIVEHANGTEKAEASGGSHDDLVMSCVGFFLCRYAQTTVVSSNEKVTKHQDIDWDFYDRSQKVKKEEFIEWE